MNAEFEFELQNLENTTDPLPFSISSMGGVAYISLSSNASLDFEEKESYLFWVSLLTCPPLSLSLLLSLSLILFFSLSLSLCLVLHYLIE